MCTTRALRTAASISSPSATLRASGFSHRIALPAAAAAMQMSRWVSLGVTTSMMSISGSSMT
jgi:hypothetical protein